MSRLMRAVRGWGQIFARATRGVQGYKRDHSKGLPVLISLLLSYLSRTPVFSWSPDLDLSDNGVYSTLLPGSSLS